MKLDCVDQMLDTLLLDIEKLNKYLDIYEMWMNLKNREEGISRAIRDRGFKKIAIYGVGRFGRNLCKELTYNEIDVLYLIDQNINIKYKNYPVYTLQDDLPETDVIIVTPIMIFDEILEMLQEKVSCPVLSLEEFIQ